MADVDYARLWEKRPVFELLDAVREHVHASLDDAAPGPLAVIDLDAGLGRRLEQMLLDHPRGGDVRVVDSEPYDAAGPARLLLCCRILGGLSGDDPTGTVARLPHWCEVGATLVWTYALARPGRAELVRDLLSGQGFAHLRLDQVGELVGFGGWAVGSSVRAGAA